MLDNNNNLIDVIFMDNTDQIIGKQELIDAYLIEYNKVLKFVRCNN